MAFFCLIEWGKVSAGNFLITPITLIIPITPICVNTKKEPLFQEALRWATRIRTWNDRTRICSVTITPWPNFVLSFLTLQK